MSKVWLVLIMAMVILMSFLPCITGCNDQDAVEEAPVSESSGKQLPEITNLELAQPYKIIGERSLAIEEGYDRSVGRWLITSETAAGFEERAQTVVKSVIDLYTLYKRDFTSVTLIARDDLERLDYASASFAADGLGPEGMTGSAPAQHSYWKGRATDYMYTETELKLA